MQVHGAGTESTDTLAAMAARHDAHTAPIVSERTLSTMAEPHKLALHAIAAVFCMLVCKVRHGVGSGARHAVRCAPTHLGGQSLSRWGCRSKATGPNPTST